MACAIAVAVACGPGAGTAERPAPPASSAPVASAAIAEPLPVPAANDVLAIVQVFARGAATEVAGDAALAAWVREFLPTLAAEAGPFELVFVVDRSLAQDAAQSLALALAGARAQLPAGGRGGLVSFAARGGSWVTRVEAPLADDVHSLIRAATRVEWSPDGGAGVAGAWAGLAELAALDWRVPPERRHVVLLLDERASDGLKMEGRPADDPGTRSRVAAWARGAVVHVVLCRLEQADGRGEGAEAPPDPGVPLATVAGLVHDGGHTRVESSAALVAAVSEELVRLADAPADLALVVDRGGVMGRSLATLGALQPALDRFVATPGHRLALLDAGDAKVLAGLADKPGVVPAALRRLRAGPPADAPRPLFTALASAQGLAWAPASRKRVIVLTGAPARVNQAADAVLEWFETAAVALQIVEPAPGFTASGRGP